MEQRSDQERGISSVPKLRSNTQSLFKLPLAPILPKKPATVSTRHGIHIFSPTQPEKDPHPAQTPSPKTPRPSLSKLPPSPPTSTITFKVRYKECQKNHAAKIGGRAVDGCGEFIPRGDEPMKCACCGCHWSFHRREVDSGERTRTEPKKVVREVVPESSSEDRRVEKNGDRRFRTKFSEEQKERMAEFAVKLGWGMRKEDEEEVKRFCGEVGLSREVFRVWMNNTKQCRKRKKHL